MDPQRWCRAALAWLLNVCPAVGWIDICQAGRRARAAGETQHRTGGRSTRNQDTTAQNAHIIKPEPTRFRNQEARWRSIPSLASSPKSGSFGHGGALNPPSPAHRSPCNHASGVSMMRPMHRSPSNTLCRTRCNDRGRRRLCRWLPHAGCSRGPGCEVGGGLS